jgi:hypothetical protein
MRRSPVAAAVIVAGLVILLDMMVVNPSLGSVAGSLQELLVLLAAAAALGGTGALAARHLRGVLQPGSDRLGSVVVLVGMGAVLLAGLRPGSNGADDPIVRWLVASLLVPLITALFALLFVFLLGAARRGLALKARESVVMLGAMSVVVIFLLPVGGAPGDWLAAGAGWLRSVPLAGVFRGLLIGVAILAAVSATRVLLGFDRVDE